MTLPLSGRKKPKSTILGPKISGPPYGFPKLFGNNEVSLSTQPLGGRFSDKYMTAVLLGFGVFKSGVSCSNSGVIKIVLSALPSRFQCVDGRELTDLS